MSEIELLLLGVIPALGFVFGAGRIVESIRNGRYVKKEVCAQIHEDEERRWSQIQITLAHIQGWMEAHK